MTNLKLCFDGGCAPKNPGGIAISACRILDNDIEIWSDCVEVCRGEGATVNVAEWHALTIGLRWLAEQGWPCQELEIIGDSKLVIEQLNGNYACNKDHLRKYLRECQDILENREWSAKWVSRKENTVCDGMGRALYREICK